MSKPVKHEVPGTNSVRTSPRIYTHATVVRHDPEWLAKHRLQKDLRYALSWAENNYLYYKKIAADGPSHSAYILSGGPEYLADWAERDAEAVAEARAFLVKFPTLEAYEKSIEEEERARFADDAKLGVYEYVESWHQSERAAVKHCATVNQKAYLGPARVALVVRAA